MTDLPFRELGAKAMRGQEKDQVQRLGEQLTEIGSDTDRTLLSKGARQDLTAHPETKTKESLRLRLYMIHEIKESALVSHPSCSCISPVQSSPGNSSSSAISVDLPMTF